MREIKLIIPNNNIEERKYIIDTLFVDFLHLDTPIITIEETEVTSLIFSDKQIIFEDHFWNFHKDDCSYLNIENLPHPKVFVNKFAPEKDIVSLYGDDTLVINEKSIICGIDIWASAFFMLTRWEEYCTPLRDEHSRFCAKDSIALKYNFLHRPIVNEYAELLWNMLKYLGFNGERQLFNFQAVITHDIDIIKSNCKLKSFIGDIVRRKDLKMALSRFSTLKDPVNTFDFLMAEAEKINQKDIFFFMASDYRIGKHHNYLNSKVFSSVIRKIRQHGHEIAFHSGYETFQNQDTFQNELQLLENKLNTKITSNRQHYLRIDIPTTFEIMEHCGIDTDYTLGYSDHEGFRCGTGNKFHIFDFLKRKKLDIKELPLIIMDGTLHNERNLCPKEAKDLYIRYFDCGRKYNMPICILFHNSSFDNYLWKGWKTLYINIIEDLM